MDLQLAVVTNDIDTIEDADFLRSAAVLGDDRIEAVRTGACPQTAVRDHITANLDAVDRLTARHPGLDLVVAVHEVGDGRSGWLRGAGLSGCSM